MAQEGFPLPRTEEEMIAILVNTGTVAGLSRLAKECRTRRLTRHDLRIIFARVVDDIGGAEASAHEFQTFQVEVAVAKAKASLKQLFEAVVANGPGD